MFGKVGFIFLVMASTACAKPQYKDPLASVKASDSQGCELQYTSNQLCVDFEWKVMPTEDEAGSMILKFHTADAPGVLVEPTYTPFVKLWMPGMGHGSSPTKTTKLQSNEYLVENVFFSMPGEWEIRIQLKNGKEVVDEVIQNFSL